MFTCASCGVEHTEGPTCTLCKHHYDFSCAGITEGGYRRLGDRKNSWRCPKCKSSPSPSLAPTSPQPGQLDKIQEQLNNVMMQLAPLATLVDDIKLIKNEIASLKDSHNTVQELIGSFSGKVDVLESRVCKVEKESQEIPALKAEISRLQQELLERDQWARSNNVEIRGIPQKKTENLYDIAQKISKACDFPVRKEDINYIARIPTRIQNNERPILISFNNKYTKEELIASLRRRKDLDLSDLGFNSHGKFYVNDHLTPRNKTLLSKARALAKERNFKYIWVKHCKIMARKSDTSPIFFIKCENDLLKIT